MATKKTKSSGVLTSSSDAAWQAQSDLDTLMRCEEIEADPKRLAAAKALAKERMQDLVNVAADKE